MSHIPARAPSPSSSSRQASMVVGRGSQHEAGFDLPPALKFTRMVTSVLATWVTAETFVGNLDDLQKSESFRSRIHRMLPRHRLVPNAFRKVRTAREVADMVRPHDTLVVSGFVAQACPDRVLQALQERYRETRQPSDLTLLFGGGPGDYATRGLNRLAEPGMLRRAIGGHYGQVPEIAKRVLNNEFAAYALPMGCISKMIRSAASHSPDFLSRIGLGTFVDPRHRGGRLNARAEEEEALVALEMVQGQEYLRYRTLPIRFAILRATTADLQGNLSFERESLLCDNRIMAHAAKASGGIVVAQVNRITEAGTISPRTVHVPGAVVDFVVQVDDEPQSFFTRYDAARSGEIRLPHQPRHQPPPPSSASLATTATTLAPGESGKAEAAQQRYLIGRRAALELSPHAIVNLGIGMPESVASVARDEGVDGHLTLTTEAGVVGGVVASGHEFGVGVNFDSLVEINHQFDFYNGGGLDVCFLGMGQVGENGSVNVSRLSPSKLTGPGGFMDIAQSTRRVVFMGSFSKKGGTVMTFQKTCGMETTFDGPRALAMGQHVMYVCERAVFELNFRGLKLIEVAPGLDVEKDVLQHLDFVPHLPASGKVKTMDERLFWEVDRPMGLVDDFFSLSRMLARRISFFASDGVVFIDISRINVTVQDLLNDLVSQELVRALHEKNIPPTTALEFVVKTDGLLAEGENPDAFREHARDAIRTCILKEFSGTVVFWNAHHQLRRVHKERVEAPEEERWIVDMLFRDFAGLGRERLSRRFLRAALEREMGIRAKPEHFAELMQGRNVVNREEFTDVVRRIRDKVYW